MLSASRQAGRWIIFEIIAASQLSACAQSCPIACIMLSEISPDGVEFSNAQLQGNHRDSGCNGCSSHPHLSRESQTSRWASLFAVITQFHRRRYRLHHPSAEVRCAAPPTSSLRLRNKNRHVVSLTIEGGAEEIGTLKGGVGPALPSYLSVSNCGVHNDPPRSPPSTILKPRSAAT